MTANKIMAAAIMEHPPHKRQIGISHTLVDWGHPAVGELSCTLVLVLLLYGLGISSLHAQQPSLQAADKTLSSDTSASKTTELGALELIERQRGGRHWIDKQTAPPRAPENAIESIKIEPGFEISLFASEPLIKDPVSICFDLQGRMFAAEYGDYPIGPTDGGKPLSRIVILSDTDQDNVADQRTVFADGLDFAHSMMAYRGGLIVAAKTKIVYLKDTDGDQIADHQETLFDGFEPAHPQMQIGCPRWGLDNWVYLNYGPGLVSSSRVPDQRVKLAKKEFRFNPIDLAFESASGRGQFGNTIDRWGEHFYCTNRNPIITTFLPADVLRRNPFHIPRTASYDVAPSGGDSKVFPLVEMKSNYLSHAGTHTSACGTTAYVGDLGDQDFQQSVFVCEPIGHLVTRSIINRDGILLSAKRAQQESDFIASTDPWFRPASLATGPDGALYLADMYRLWVEHPKFLPPEIAARLDWRAGDDRGRIYRITPSNYSPALPYRAPANQNETIRMLSSQNGWRQFQAQRVLVEQQPTGAAEKIRPLLSSKNPTAILHAMWTLHGLNKLTAADVLTGLGASHANVRVNALKLAIDHLDNQKVLGAVVRLAHDQEVIVRLQTALTLSVNKSDSANDALIRIARRDADDPMFADAMLTSLSDRSAMVLQALVSVSPENTPKSPQQATAEHPNSELVQKLATIVGARGAEAELSQLLSLFPSDGHAPWWCAAAINGLSEGLTRYRGKMGRLSLSKLLSNPPATLRQKLNGLQTALTQIQSVATNPRQNVAERVAAIKLLAHQETSSAILAFETLLSSIEPLEVQIACLHAMKEHGSKDVVDLLLNHWSDLLPESRVDALEMLLRRKSSTESMLAAMSNGSIRAAALSIEQRVRLLKHYDEEIKQLANQLFGGAVSGNRLQVAKEYELALSIQPNNENGRAVFTRVCSNCHRIDSLGHQTGPDLSDVANRSKAALLYDILDPNAKVEPHFMTVSILTDDGSTFTGLMASETSDAVVLKLAEGKTKTIGRAGIERIKANDVSMMPEGIEKEITPQQMADLLAFLKREP